MGFKNYDIRIALLDLNNGHPNQGMRNIREIVARYQQDRNIDAYVQEFDVRQHNQLPDLSFDVYVSSGGPGSPYEDGMDWERRYFRLLRDLCEHNRHADRTRKKFVFFICHSFQLACRFFNVGNVTLRKSNSFGVFPTHKTEAGRHESVFEQLPDPFYIVDSRDWQVVGVNEQRLAEMGGAVLALEKERPHVLMKQAAMAIRFSPEMIGTQFHPEADAQSMRNLLNHEEWASKIIGKYGPLKYEETLSQLADPDKIMLTQEIIIPTFLDNAIQACNSEALLA